MAANEFPAVGEDHLCVRRRSGVCSPVASLSSTAVPATQREWIKRLQREGWTLERGGKHQVKMTKPGQRPITLPENKRRAYSKGFEAQLRREAGLTDPSS